MKKCIAIVSNEAYVEYTKYLIGALRSTGKWNGDITLLSNGLLPRTKDMFTRKGIYVKPFSESPCQWFKVNLFDRYFRGVYDRMLYLDQDVVVFGDVEPIFEQEGEFIADHDAKPIIREFSGERNLDLYKEMEQQQGVNEEAFCAGMMLFDTKNLCVGTESIEALREKYSSINTLNGIKNGYVDQPILNLWLAGRWKPFDRACFWGVRKPDTLIAHCTSWYAPWEKTGSQSTELLQKYREALKFFREQM